MLVLAGSLLVLTGSLSVRGYFVSSITAFVANFPGDDPTIKQRIQPKKRVLILSREQKQFFARDKIELSREQKGSLISKPKRLQLRTKVIVLARSLWTFLRSRFEVVSDFTIYLQCFKTLYSLLAHDLIFISSCMNRLQIHTIHFTLNDCGRTS